jgi:GTPase SAR1 family protein
MLLDAGADVNAPCRGGETALGIAFFVFHTNCDHAYPITYALCSRGAEWDATCDERLSQGRSRAKDKVEKSQEHDSTETVEELRQELRQELMWRLGLRECVVHWTAQRRASDFELVQIPIEVINQGPESVQTYLHDLDRTGLADLVYRRKICVVGPSEWGKTSLVKSLTTLKPSLVHKDDRTIGIDLDECVFDKSSIPLRRRHEVTFWDFAGQEIYQVAHSLFYSKRTLYLICVDLEAYAQTLDEAAAMATLRQSEAAITRFVRRHIFRWIRSIFSRQPDAEFVVVGTKSDQLRSAEATVEIWRDLRMHLSDWQAKFIAELEQEHRAAQDAVLAAQTPSSAKSYAFLRAGKSDVLAQLDALKAKVIHTVSDDWLVVSNAEYLSVLSARDALELHLTRSDRCFQMTVTYRRVLEIIKQRRRDARAMDNARDRIENTILPYKALLRVLLREVDGLREGDCASILRTLHELGDILWYEREGAGALRDTVILDPTLVLDFVREVINHRHVENTDAQAGRVTHATLCAFPLWCELDQELLHAFKLLLQYFQLAYPADGKAMDWDADLIVPTYWKQQATTTSDSTEAEDQDDFFERHGFRADDASRSICWEYELSSDVSETVFEHFAVQSYSALFGRTVKRNCIESFIDGAFASRIELCQDESESRDVIRLQAITPVAAAACGGDTDDAWHCLRYFVMTMEKVLDAYAGLTASRYIVDMATPDKRTRHRVHAVVKMLEDAVSLGRDVETLRADRPWLPKDLGWYIEKAWRQPGLLHELRTRTLLKELVSKTDVLKRLLVAGETKRRYPALWTLTTQSDTSVAELRLLSDLSGQCFHEPLTFELPSSFLARHGSVFKAGLSICSTVVHSVLSLGVLDTVLSAASSGESLSQPLSSQGLILYNLCVSLTQPLGPASITPRVSTTSSTSWPSRHLPGALIRARASASRRGAASLCCANCSRSVDKTWTSSRSRISPTCSAPRPRAATTCGLTATKSWPWAIASRRVTQAGTLNSVLHVPVQRDFCSRGGRQRIRSQQLRIR